MYAGILELLAGVLFIGSIWNCVRVEGRARALQWFLPAYLYTVMREIVVGGFLQSYAYSAQLTFIGGAAVFVGMLRGSLYYLAREFARRFTGSPPRIAALMFFIAASFALPLEAIAAQLHWWTHPSPRWVLFGGVPLFAPIIWGVGAVVFYGAFARVRRTFLPERGKLYALITLAPILALVDALVAFLFEV